MKGEGREREGGGGGENTLWVSKAYCTTILMSALNSVKGILGVLMICHRSIVIAAIVIVVVVVIAV